MTAREAAEKIGVTERHIRRVVAEPREEYLARAAAQRERILELREQGMKHREIAATLGIPLGTVGTTLWHAKKRQETPAVAV
jgi:hypothetical protein